MKVQRTGEKPIYFDHYDPDALRNIIDIQHNNTRFMKTEDAIICAR